MILWFAAAFAAPTITIARPDAKLLEPLGPPPEKGAELKEWTRQLYLRADQDDLDAVLARRGDLVAACIADKAAEGATATVQVSIAEDGTLKKVEVKGGDAAVGTCAVSAWSGLRLPVIRHDPGHATYTLTVGPAGAPPASALDRETGFGNLAWGTDPAAVETLEYHSASSGIQLYGRASDRYGRWFGVSLGTVNYAFSDDKLWMVSLGVAGTAQSYDLRQALIALYGPAKWDVAYNCWYWRGEHVLLQATPVKGTDVLVLSWIDIQGAYNHGLTERLPGDRADPAAPATGRRLPKIYKDDAPEPVPPEAPVTPAP